MKKHKNILSVMILTIVLILSGLAMQTGCKKQTGLSAGSSTAGLQAKEIYYCPMHPDQVSDKPGKCPKCGMDLVKKEAGQPAADTNKP